MSNKLVKPVSVAVGLALAGSAAVVSADNLFALNDLGGGYALVGAEGSCGEGKCGEGKCGEGKTGEGRCGMDHLDTDGDGRISAEEWQAAGKPADKWAQIDADGDGYITAEEWQTYKDAEGKCGEGKCGEGKCGEGKCGEGKCGGSH